MQEFNWTEGKRVEICKNVTNKPFLSEADLAIELVYWKRPAPQEATYSEYRLDRNSLVLKLKKRLLDLQSGRSEAAL